MKVTKNVIWITIIGKPLKHQWLDVYHIKEDEYIPIATHPNESIYIREIACFDFSLSLLTSLSTKRFIYWNYDKIPFHFNE